MLSSRRKARRHNKGDHHGKDHPPPPPPPRRQAGPGQEGRLLPQGTGQEGSRRPRGALTPKHDAFAGVGGHLMVPAGPAGASAEFDNSTGPMYFTEYPNRPATG